jgi:hypothetical protein
MAWARATGSEGGVAFVLVDDAEGAAGAGAGAGAAPEASVLRRAFGIAAEALRDQLSFGAFSSAAVGMASLRAALGGGAADALLAGAAPPFVARIEAADQGGARLLSAAQLRDMAAVLAAGGSGSGSASAPVYRVKSAARRNVAGAEARAAAAAAAAGDAAHAAEALRGWLLHHKYATVSRLGNENFAYLANNGEGRYVAIVCHSTAEAPHAIEEAASGGGAPSPTVAALRTLRRLASPATSSLPPAVRDRLIFGTLEQEQFSAFLEQFSLKACPQLLVVDAPNKAFWTDATVVEESDYDTFLTDVVEGRAPMQKQGLMATPQKIANTVGRPAAYALGALGVLLLLWGLWELVIAEALGFKDAARRAAAAAAAEKAEKAAAAADAVADAAREKEGSGEGGSSGGDSAAAALRRRNVAGAGASVAGADEGAAATPGSSSEN